MRRLRGNVIATMVVMVLAGFLFVINTSEVSYGGFLTVAGIGGDGNVYLDIEIEKVELDRTELARGDTLNVKVTIRNRGDMAMSQAQLFLIAGEKVVESRLVDLYLFGVDERQVVTISWNTGDVEPGEYQLRVEIPIIPDADEFDNEYTVPGKVIIR